VACSTEGAALCYRTISLVGGELIGRHAHPEVSLHSHPLSEYMEHIYRDDWKGVARLMLSSAEKLARCGADFLICPTTPSTSCCRRCARHRLCPGCTSARWWPPRPGGSATGASASRGRGTRWKARCTPRSWGPRASSNRAPGAEARALIDRIIFDELVNGRFTAESLRVFQREIASLREEGCDAVILGCTEIPLLVPPEESPLPTLDSTRLLARAAVEHALRA